MTYFIEYKIIEEGNLQQKKDIYSIMTKEAIKETNEQINNSFNKSFKKQLQSSLNNINNNNKNTLVVNKCKAYLVSKAIGSYQNIEDLLKKIYVEK